MIHAKHQRFFASTIVCVIAFSLLIVVLRPEAAISQGSSGPITGYAWSDTIGWVSLGGSGYGLTVDGSGKLSGYAWSDSIGWITSNESELSGCPQNPCRAKIQAGLLTGWLKALAGGGAESGGWDGWISLSGSGYGVTQSSGALDGFAWGDTVVGWLDFDAATGFEECAATQGYFCAGNVQKHRDAQCNVTTIQTCSYLCSAGACVPAPAPTGLITVSPQIIMPGNSATVSWDIDNALSCTVVGENGDSWSGVSGTQLSSPINDTTTFTLSCTGLDGTSLQASDTVSLNPEWQEL